MRKRITQSFSVLLAASMLVSSAPITALASGTATEEQVTESVSREAAEDGVHDAWVQDQATVKGTDAVNEVTSDGWLHLKAGSGNGNANNNAASYPAVFVHPNTFDFAKEGYIEFDLKTEQAGSLNRFGVFLGYDDPGNGMFLGYDSFGWFWQKYTGGDGAWYSGTRVSAPEAGATVHVHISWTGDKKATLKLGDQVVFENEDFSGIAGTLGSGIGIKASTNKTDITDVYLKNIHYTGQSETEVSTYAVNGTVVNAENQPLEGALISINGKKAMTDAAGAYVVDGLLDGTYTMMVSKTGYLSASVSVTVDGNAVSLDPVTLEIKQPLSGRVISSDSMDVLVAESFPSVIQYTMKGDWNGKIFYGQTQELDTIQINGKSIQVTEENLEVEFKADKAVYTMDLKADHVDCTITAELEVVKNTLEFNITKVVNNLQEKDAKGQEMYPVQKIYIPNHSLVSVRSTQESANLKGAKVSNDTLISGDKSVNVTDSMSFSKEDFMYGFVSNNELSAGLWSNSEYNGTHIAAYVKAGGASNTRVIAETANVEDGKSVGLASAEWYYDRKITPEVNGETQTYVVKHAEMPSAKVAIAGDVNSDSEINWQDGAIAFREIMHTPFKSAEVPELVNQRIAMNFGSQAANPFLTTLDGVKRVYLNTDGLGQSILLKGYGSEGHDSGHPDYGDIGTRIGGAEDMNQLMEEGKDLGAVFGIHINASEMYTEAKAFNDDLSGGNYGWNWLDQGIGINGLYDLGSGARETRLAELKEKVGDNMDFIYLDVWGNETSGAEDAWESRNIARQMNAKGWRFTTEWGATHEYDSTMQHWAADLKYGGAAAKGQNSEVMRFIRNHQKDSWIADYPSYNGAAQMPLLGGLNMTDFEGWSGRTDYDNYIKVMFRHNLVTKFLQHYKVMKWVDGSPVTMNGKSWTPEMEITLQDKSKDNTIVVSRGSNDNSDLKKFRSRTITLNGNVISQGAPTGGDGSNPGDEAYLIPWYWAADGKPLAEDDQKLYHWNTKGGTTTWTLPKEWDALQNVVVYTLSDEGKSDERTVPVTDGTITLENMKAEIPYVVYKGEKEQLQVDWQASKYIYDMGFNDSDLAPYWTKAGTGTAEIADNSSANKMLKLSGEVSLTSQALTNLIPGQRYALYIGVDNRSDAKAHMTIKSGEEVLADNYTEASFVQNMISSDQHHTGSGGTVGDISYFQNMYVFFTAPQSGDVTLTLSRKAGVGDTYFDDVRIVETKMDMDKETGENGLTTKLYQDFENNAQGIYPFVISGPGSGAGWVTDNRIHLSQAHDKYTKAGYKDKRVDDVIDGDWSVKINGLVQENSMIYQTIPQNFHFEAGETYFVSFDYQLGSEGTYEVRVGDGRNNNVKSFEMPEAIGKTKKYGFTFTASNSQQSWFGIYSTGKAPDMKEFAFADKGPKNFSGYKDFILDNLRIEKAHMTISETQIIKRTAKNDMQLNVGFVRKEDEDTKVIWKSSDESVAVVDQTGKVRFLGYGTAGITASAVFEGETKELTCLVRLIKEDKDEAEFVDAWTNTQETSGEDGRAINVTDGNPSTIWHSQWSGNAFQVSESNPAIITVELQDDISNYPYAALHQRNGSNGLIQKYTYVIGDTFDSSTNTVSGTSVGPVTAKNSVSDSFEELEIPEGTTGRYLQIRVLQGSNNFAAMADILINSVISYDTPQEKIYLAKNKRDYVIEQKAEAQAYYEKLVEDQATEAEIEAAKNRMDTLAKEAQIMDDYLKALEALKQAQDLLDQANKDKDQALADKEEAEKAAEEAKKAAEAAAAEAKEAAAKLEAAEKEAKAAKEEAEKQAAAAAEAAKKKEEAEKAAAEAAKKKEEAEKAAAEAAKKQEEAEKAAAEAAKKQEEAEKAAKEAAEKAAAEKAAAEKLKAELEKAKQEIENLKAGQGSTIKAGDKADYKNVTYKVLNAENKTAAAVGGKDVSNLMIAKTVKIKGVTCKVTEIASGAFKNAKKLTKVTIGGNVQKIGSKAFFNAKKLKTVNIKTVKLKTVGSKAFVKIDVKARFAVPSAKKAAYKGYLKKKIPAKAIVR